MSKNIALKVAGTIFGLVSLAHLIRVFYHAEVIVSGHVLSMEVSYVGFFVALGLSIWMFAASRR